MDYLALSIEERLRLIEDIWESIVADGGEFVITQEQKDELDRRLEEYQADGDRSRP